jgi:hypothetical protein
MACGRRAQQASAERSAGRREAKKSQVFHPDVFCKQTRTCHLDLCLRRLLALSLCIFPDKQRAQNALLLLSTDQRLGRRYLVRHRTVFVLKGLADRGEDEPRGLRNAKQFALAWPRFEQLGVEPALYNCATARHS